MGFPHVVVFRPGDRRQQLPGRAHRGAGAAGGAESDHFPYDWRLDNRVSAGLLAKRAPDWLRAWREAGGPANARLVFAAHAMGGLVARHAIEVQGLRELTAGLVTVGTPHRGVPNAVLPGETSAG